MKIVTGATGTAHVTAADDGALNAVMFEGAQPTGSDYVLPVGDNLEVETISASKIRIKSGDIMMQGRHGRIPHGTYDEVTIENGTTGYSRNDLIVCRYENTDGVESMTLNVIKGTPTTGTAKDPSYTTGNILNGDMLHEFPLYRVKLSGINLDAVEGLFNTWTASATHSHTMNQIQGELPLDRTSGVLPIANGGTGEVSALNAFRTLLNAYTDTYDAIPVNKGGTGASTYWGARNYIVSPHILEAGINSQFTIPKELTKIPFTESDNACNDNLFAITNGTIQRNDAYALATEYWPNTRGKKVFVEFTLYFYMGFTSGENTTIKLYKNGTVLNRKWVYYVKAANPYTMYTGNCWVYMDPYDTLDLRIRCTSGKGSIGYGDGIDTRLTVTTWD